MHLPARLGNSTCPYFLIHGSSLAVGATEQSDALGVVFSHELNGQILTYSLLIHNYATYPAIHPTRNRSILIEVVQQQANGNTDYYTLNNKPIY